MDLSLVQCISQKNRYFRGNDKAKQIQIYKT